MGPSNSQLDLYVDALNAEDCELVRRWRLAVPVGLRTPFLMTVEMQRAFYDHVVCNRDSPHRYYAVRQDFELVAQAGLVDIQHENGLAEISLITDPNRRRQGIGRATVQLVLREAFENLRLLTVIGEVYTANPALVFWQAIVLQHGGNGVFLPRRKFWLGQLWDSWSFTISQEAWSAHRV